MKPSLTEVVDVNHAKMGIARSVLAQVPGIHLVGFEQPQDLWMTNPRGWQTISSIQVEPGSSRAHEWLHQIAKQERLEGTWNLLFFTARNLSFEPIWVQIYLSPNYEWIEILWNTMARELNFVSIDGKYRLHISVDEWQHLAQRKVRGESTVGQSHIDLASTDLIRIKRVDSLHAISSDTNGDAQVWRIRDRGIFRFLQGYGGLANAQKVGKLELISKPIEYDDRLFWWNYSTGDILGKTKRYREVSGINRFLKGSKSLIVTSLSEYPWGAATWDMHSGEIINRFGLGQFIERMIRIDRKHILVGLDEGTLQVWDFLKEELILSSRVHEGHVSGLVARDGSTILSSSSDGILSSWDINTGYSNVLLELGNSIGAIALLDSGILTISALDVQGPLRLDWWDLGDFRLMASTQTSGNKYSVSDLEILDKKTIVVQFSSAIQIVEIAGDKHGRSLIVKEQSS